MTTLQLLAIGLCLTAASGAATALGLYVTIKKTGRSLRILADRLDELSAERKAPESWRNDTL